MKKTLLKTLLLAGFAASTLCAFEVTKDTQIVIGDKVPESTILAAKEFAHYAGKVSGFALKTVKGKSNASSKVVIGTLENVKDLPSSAAKKLSSAKSPDAFAIVSKGNTLYIVGKDRVGELYGTYAFLDEKVGIRWFRAATKRDAYEYIPAKTALKFADFEIVRDPVFRYRQLSHVGATGKAPVNGQTVAVRQGFQINPPWSYKRAFKEKFYMERTSILSIGDGGHLTFTKPVPQSLFEKHPEYFALQNGKRVKGQQICISNAEVQKRIYDYVESIYKEVPADKFNYLFGMIDVTTGWCECAECRKLDETEKFDYINVSTRFHKVVTKIMAQLYKKYPAALLESWAYHTYRSIPKNVKYDKRAIIYYCTHGRCYGHELNDPSCQRNVTHLNLMKAWGKISSRMRLYEYANCTSVMYGCLEEIQAKDLRFFRKMGWEGWKEEMLFADAQFWPPAKKGVKDFRADRANANWQWYCVTGKMLWNPDLDPAKILEDVESKYYGKAYPAMKKYHDYRRELWNNSSYCLGYPTGDQRRPQLLSVPGAKEKLLAFLDEADRLAGNDAILKGRLKDDRDWLNRYWIEPNDKMRAQLGRACSAPTRVGNIKIDGDPSDAEWNRAWHTSDFKFTFGSKRGQNVDKDHKTVLSILSDDDHLYFRVVADAKYPGKLKGNCKTKDGNVFHDDSVEFFIMPPSAAQEYYQVAVSVSGAVYDARCPGNHSKEDLGVVAAVKRTKKGFAMEVKVPLAKMGKAERGALWKVHATRCVTAEKESDAAAGFQMSLDGTPHHDTVNYRGIIIGTPILKNGTFETLNKKGMPADWAVKNCSIEANGASNALKLLHSGFTYQLLAGGELGQKPFPRKIRVTFRASGKGTLLVSAQRYCDTRDVKAKHGYRRTNLPTTGFFKAQLDKKQKLYTCEYTINANEWMGLRFTVPGKKGDFVLLDDVSVTKLDK